MTLLQYVEDKEAINNAAGFKYEIIELTPFLVAARYEDGSVTLYHSSILKVEKMILGKDSLEAIKAKL